jgi:hypothetical protein
MDMNFADTTLNPFTLEMRFAFQALSQENNTGFSGTSPAHRRACPVRGASILFQLKIRQSFGMAFPPQALRPTTSGK